MLSIQHKTLKMKAKHIVGSVIQAYNNPRKLNIATKKQAPKTLHLSKMIRLAWLNSAKSIHEEKSPKTNISTSCLKMESSKYKNTAKTGNWSNNRLTPQKRWMFHTNNLLSKLWPLLSKKSQNPSKHPQDLQKQLENCFN